MGECHRRDFGKLMRRNICGVFKDKKDTFCYCYGDSTSKPLPYEQARTVYESSDFCLLPPGDTLSTRRLSDIIVSGCIPVFVGFENYFSIAPLSNLINYSSFALFYHVGEFGKLLQGYKRRRFAKIMASKYWFGAIPPSHVRRVASVQAMYDSLMGIPPEVRASLKSTVASVRPKFTLDGELATLILNDLCLQRYRQFFPSYLRV
jgi:hypothetical protein